MCLFGGHKDFQPLCNLCDQIQFSGWITLTYLSEMMGYQSFGLNPGGGGYSVQKTLRGRAANMGSKISLLLYECPLKKCRIWYMNGSIFQNFPKFEPKLGRLVYEWVTFSWKIGICMGLLSNFAAAPPYQNQTQVTPPPSPPGSEYSKVLTFSNRV